MTAGHEKRAKEWSKWKKYLLVLLFAVLLEVIFFQRDVWLLRLKKDTPTQLAFSLTDMEKHDWSGEDTVSAQEGAYLLIYTEPMYVGSLTFTYRADRQISKWRVLYTSASGTVEAVDVTEQNGRVACTLNREVGPILRIDPVPDGETALTELQLMINDTALHISAARIITVMLVYTIGSLLMRIQRMPDYTKYIHSEKERKA